VKPDKIHILNLRLPITQLEEITKTLVQDGFQCVVSSALEPTENSWSQAEVKLLIVGADDEDLPDLLSWIPDANDSGLFVPILVCLAHSPSQNYEFLFAPEIDDFLLPPLHLPDIQLRVNRLLQQQSKKTIAEATPQTRKSGSLPVGSQALIGKSETFLAIKEKIPRVAACNATVLITGETGTGKELCARAIHYFSPQGAGPFVPVNCSAIPTELFENELFGHESGAFTDARQSRCGLIAEAEGGTLFLDEVDTLQPLSQVKLLRFLQDHQYKPLGSSRYRQANIRLLAATNRDLLAKVREDTFREDLYFRLNLVSLRLPALRQRREDVVLLAHYFMEQASRDYRRPVSQFSHKAILKMSAYQWPGNVRELENVIRQAVIMAESTMIHDYELNFSIEGNESAPSWKEPFNVAKARMIEAFERDYLRHLLVACGGNITQAAREAQKDRRTFFGMLKKYGLTQMAKNGCQ
jgi:two-component system, NtrC family, response regulator GlrR